MAGLWNVAEHWVTYPIACFRWPSSLIIIILYCLPKLPLLAFFFNYYLGQWAFINYCLILFVFVESLAFFNNYNLVLLVFIGVFL